MLYELYAPRVTYLNTLAEDGDYWTGDRTKMGYVAHPLAILAVLVPE
jgi:hypothetical protein